MLVTALKCTLVFDLLISARFTLSCCFDLDFEFFALTSLMILSTTLSIARISGRFNSMPI